MQELVADLVWTDNQPMRVLGLPLGRRLALARGAADRLVVFSPLEATPLAIEALRARGEIAAFIVPSRFHDRFYQGYFEAFPRARFLASRSVIHDHPRWPLTELAAGLPELGGFDVELLAGAPQVDEQVFLHRASRTLIIADAFFNLPQPDAWWPRLMMRLADMGGRPRPSRLFRSCVRDRAAFAASVRRVLAWDFDRIVPGHGGIITSGGKDVWRDAFREILAA